MPRYNPHASRAHWEPLLEAVQLTYGISRAQLMHPTRGPEPIAFARMVAMTLLYERGGASQRAIASYFGRKVPQSVNYARRAVQRAKLYPGVRQTIDRLRSQIP